MTASNLYKIDIDGKVILKPDTAFGVNTAAFVIHSAVHRARGDLKCVIHTHTRAGMAISALKCGILPLNQVAMRFYERTGFHDFEEPFGRLDHWVEGVPRLLSYGRQGLFAHDNTHHALYMAYCAAECLSQSGFDERRWAEYRKVFATHVVED